MTALLSHPDPDGLLEYSVVYTDRALNHMSLRFQGVIRSISDTLQRAYHSHSSVIVPGSGTFGMEAVARQFATNGKCLVIRNGWFSYRWSQILEMGQIAAESVVLKARPTGADKDSPFSPPPLSEVLSRIQEYKPQVVFAPHVETASGIVLPADYLQAVGAAVHEVGGLFVLDCIASGNVWVDIQSCNVDVLISAPQKGWSSPACCALIALSERARRRIDETNSTSFACDLKKWTQIMDTYLQGGYAYHATMPTDALATLSETMREVDQHGFSELCSDQWKLGTMVRELLSSFGYSSVASAGFMAPSVIVCFTENAAIQTGKRFSQLGVQIAAGVPLQCDERSDFRSFRIGLFGLDKLKNPERTVDNLRSALQQL